MNDNRDNFARLLAHKRPFWTPVPEDFQSFNPSMLADNAARSLVESGEPDAGVCRDACDMFGVPWRYIKEAYGAITPPGSALLSDAEDWPKTLTFPEIGALDWQGCYERNAPWFNDDQIRVSCILNGFFERLISLMGMEEALISMITQQQAVAALFDRLAELYIDIIRHMRRYFNTEMILLHDDWGHAQAPFFAANTIERTVAPALRRVTSYAKSLGMAFELHSCGLIAPLVPVMIDCGVDIWRGQAFNDMETLYRMYGDKLVFQFDLPVREGAEEASIRAAIRAFLESHPRGDYLIAPPCPRNGSALLREESRALWAGR